jgi:DNA-binding CsgD family transcriptional regulator
MIPKMVRIHAFLDSNSQVRHLRVSLPLVGCLLDGRKYFQPSELGEDREARFRRPPRAPSFKWLVREAVAREIVLEREAQLRRRERARALVAYGMRQVDIAQALGVSKQTVSQDLAEMASALP